MPENNSNEKTCAQCGMKIPSYAHYHPYAACMMFRGNGCRVTVQENLRYVVEYGMKALSLGLTIEEAMTDISKIHTYGSKKEED